MGGGANRHDMDAQWRIELFGGLRVQGGDRVISRFPTQKTGALLAYLGYHLDSTHPREVLVELLWPESLPSAGRNSLSKALSSLRQELEPPGVPAGAVIIADRASVRLNSETVTTDVAQFESALQLAGRTRSRVEQMQHLADAVELYRGEFLLGYYEDWIPPEQRRLEDLFFQALCQLMAHLKEAGYMNRALDYAHQGVRVDPLREEVHHELMRLYIAAGQPSAALRQYHELEQILDEKLNTTPSAATRALLQEIRQPKRERPASPVVADASVRRRQTPAPTRESPLPLLQFPLAVSPPASVGSLPLPLTRFFGREREMEQLRGLLCHPEIRLNSYHFQAKAA